MNRVSGPRFGAVIGEGLARIPERIRERLTGVQWFTGDPVFAGLHSVSTTNDGRSYSDTAHACYPWHIERPASERMTTIVLPTPRTPEVVVHELGHALDWTLGFSTPAPVPVSWYAETNRREAFAEAFTAWLNPHYGDQDALASDRRTLALFEELARC